MSANKSRRVNLEVIVGLLVFLCGVGVVLFFPHLSFLKPCIRNSAFCRFIAMGVFINIAFVAAFVVGIVRIEKV